MKTSPARQDPSALVIFGSGGFRIAGRLISPGRGGAGAEGRLGEGEASGSLAVM
jgi:hypothetical protein